MHRSIARISTVLLLSVAPASGEVPAWAGRGRPELAARALRGEGTWKTAGVKRRELQRWSLDVKRGEDGVLTGTVAVEDSPLLASGIVSGKIIGNQVSGTITAADTGEVVRFWGVAKGRQLRGTYFDRTGETGEWAWEGLLPE